jgi:dTDP-4-dehydrorhamnose 3,5-epimerase
VVDSPPLTWETDHSTFAAGAPRLRCGAMPIEVSPTTLPSALLLKPRAFPDARGFFAETYRANELAAAGIAEDFVQDNHSRSTRGVLRGLHFAIGAGSSKLVRCGRGAIWDVIVDLRAGSPTYGRWEGFDLTDENMHVLYVPVGFAHGFCVMSDVADVLYKQSAYYDTAVERGIAWNDPDVAVGWPLPAEEIVVSDRDTDAPRLADIADELPFAFSG